MEKLRVGVAGLGRGKLFVDLFAQLPACEMVAVCDPAAPARAAYEHLAAHAEYDDFLGEGLDVVAIISPGPLHAEQSIQALEAGAHVLCETPCVYSLDEARAVANAVRRTNRTFMLAEDYIWLGWAVNLKEQADQGLFGEIVYAEGDYTHDCRDIMLATDEGYIPYAERDRHPQARKTWRATHLPPLSYTSHTLGPLLTIMDDRVVTAIGLSTGVRTAPDLGAIDLEAGLFQTEKGAIIRLTNGFSLAHPMALHYSLAGTRGAAKMQRTSTTSFVWHSEAADPPIAGWQPAPEEWQERPDHAPHLEVMVGEFVASLVDGTPPPLDVYRSLEFVLPGLIAHQSALQGGVKLEVPDLRGESA